MYYVYGNYKNFPVATYSRYVRKPSLTLQDQKLILNHKSQITDHKN